jgi:DNA-binding MarR family transcriptional regulator
VAVAELLSMDPVIHQTTRLRVLATLQRNRDVAFVELRDALGTTDGNLDSHGRVLQRAGYITIRRALGPGGFAVRYRITPAGASAFEAYARELRGLLDGAGVASA